MFVISDFISAPGWERPLSLLNQRHEVLAVRLWDPREVELPDVGPMIMEDAETGEQLYVDTHDKKFRARFKQAARQREADAEWDLQTRRGGCAVALNRKKTWCAPSCVLPRCASSGGNYGKHRLMSFIWPAMLVFLLLIPLCRLVLPADAAAAQRFAASYGSFGSGRQQPGTSPVCSRHIPPALFSDRAGDPDGRAGAPKPVSACRGWRGQSSWPLMSPAAWPPTI